MKNYQAILLSVASSVLVIKTLNGSILKYMHFAGVLNEMAFAFIMFLLTIAGLTAIDYKKLIKSLF